MAHDKQLSNVELDRVVEKRRLDQALNTKEFAVLAGISYSAARGWFHVPGFPVFRGVVFWQDFLEWRNARNGLRGHSETASDSTSGEGSKKTCRFTSSDLPPRARQILREVC